MNDKSVDMAGARGSICRQCTEAIWGSCSGAVYQADL